MNNRPAQQVYKHTFQSINTLFLITTVFNSITQIGFHFKYIYIIPKDLSFYTVPLSYRFI